MIEYKHIPDMIRELNTPYIRIHDSNETLLYSIVDCKTVDQTIKRLDKFKNNCNNYRCIYITAATQKHYEGNFRGAFIWEVLVSTEVKEDKKEVVVSQSSELQKLTIQFETLKLTHKFEEKMRELEEKYERRTEKKPFDILPFIPLAGKLLGWGSEQISEVVKMAGGTSENIPQLSGQPQTNELTMSMTEDEQKEKEQQIEKLTTALFNHIKHDKMLLLISNINGLVNKIGVDKLIKMTSHLEKNPAQADTLISMIP